MKNIILIMFFLMPVILVSQTPNNDLNWNTTPHYQENFTGTRLWNSIRHDNTWSLICYYGESGVIHDTDWDDCKHGWHQMIYQRENAIFDPSSTGFMRLRAEYNPGYDFNHPDFWCPQGSYRYVDCPYDYVSGAIEVISPSLFKYGYFEIKCALPVANYGNFPAFWLFSKEGGKYNEIDIFEHLIRYNVSPDISIPNDKGSAYDSQCIFGTFFETQYTETEEDPREKYEITRYYLEPGEQPLTSMHTYAIEWSPGLIIWYFDGKPIGEVFNHPHITDQPMHLKANLAIADSNFVKQRNNAQDVEMTIDHIKVYKLMCDCNNDVNITSSTQLNSLSQVKKNITVANTGTTIIATGSGNVIRATSSITINGNFEVPLGAEFMAITHACPE